MEDMLQCDFWNQGTWKKIIHNNNNNVGLKST